MTPEQTTQELNKALSLEIVTFINSTGTSAEKIGSGEGVSTSIQEVIHAYKSFDIEVQDSILEAIELHNIKPSRNPGGSPNG